jgi:hypothetical protein
MWIFRAMEEENGLPKLGISATTLGVRPGKDIAADANGMVDRPKYIRGDANGLSCAPSADDVPPFAKPVAAGGRNKKTKIWRISADDLGPDLSVKEDSRASGPRHVSVGPARMMTFDEYQAAVQATRSKWHAV